MMKKNCYIVVLHPKTSDVGTRVLKPYKKNICWNEKRAIKEFSHLKKHSKVVIGGNQSMTYHISELFKGEIKKVRK